MGSSVAQGLLQGICLNSWLPSSLKSRARPGVGYGRKDHGVAQAAGSISGVSIRKGNPMGLVPPGMGAQLGAWRVAEEALVAAGTRVIWRGPVVRL